MSLIKKISAKTVLGNIISIVRDVEIGCVIEGYAVAGFCDGYETGMSTYGEWRRFVGDFHVTNYVTGECNRAPACHVPDLLDNILYNSIKDSVTVDASRATKTTKYFGLANRIEFAFKVDIKRLEDDEKEGIKYEFLVTPLTEIASNDALQHLVNLIPQKKLAIAGPSEKSTVDSFDETLQSVIEKVKKVKKVKK
jgi:hypothetical protein